MATIDQTSPPALTPASPTSVQPGGHSIATHLEVIWGQWRRAFLRRFRPGYVEDQKQLRQGDCPDCPHDIVDSRDLKFLRNVCGYHFGRGDDPYSQRAILPLARAGRAEVVFYGVLLGGVAAVFALLAVWLDQWAFLLGSAIAIGFWLFLVSFFRDPERTIPTDTDALLSPADGTIMEVGEVAEEGFPGGRAFRIVIFLSPFNVHVNRVPRTGKVVGLRYFRGRFQAAMKGDCDKVNEQFWLDLEEPSGRLVRIKQVSGAVARRIVCWARPNEDLKAGERYGMIKLGSRTDVLIPAGEAIDVLVKKGDAVRGGLAILLRFRGSPVI
jgi:phosphatidylserine decarboxylase